MRKTDPSSPYHRDYLPHRNYFSMDVQPPALGEVYPVDVEIWPTNVMVGRGGTLGLQISSHDTQGSGLFEHTHPEDRAEKIFKGINCVHVGPESYLTLPVIPKV
jgi:predicted acyl esterase